MEVLRVKDLSEVTEYYGLHVCVPSLQIHMVQSSPPRVIFGGEAFAQSLGPKNRVLTNAVSVHIRRYMREMISLLVI